MLSQRFINYFNDYQIHVNGKEADECFRAELAKAPVKLFDHTLEVIQQLKLNHSLYSNQWCNRNTATTNCSDTI